MNLSQPPVDNNRQIVSSRADIASYETPRLAQWLLDTGARRRQVAAQRTSSTYGGFARSMIHKQLASMKKGRLLIKEGEVRHEFGLESSTQKNLNDDHSGATIVVRNPAVYRRMLLNGVLGAAEAYMEGDWETTDLVSVVRFFVSNLEELQAMNKQRSWLNRAALASLSWVHRNTTQRSHKNISAHYDLGNDFFGLFLDPTMLYSSAIFERNDMTLEQASIAKLDRLCRKLELKAGDHLLEIGTGWGAMAVYAAENYGCKVTTTTISLEQFKHTRNLVRQKGLQDRVTVLKKDYRDLSGHYDKLVSIEMIEAVGHQYYAQYFATCSKLLKPDGLMAIQAITIPDQRYTNAKKNVDFIKRYIFPGGCLPSIGVVAEHIAKDSDMVIADVFDITEDYAKTLARWREAFFEKLGEVEAMGFDQQFIRMWEYYLCYCEGGFLERAIGTHQFLFSKPGYRRDLF